MKQKIKLIRLADVKAYIGLLDREEITMSKFAEIIDNPIQKAEFVTNDKEISKKNEVYKICQAVSLYRRWPFSIENISEL